MVGFSTYFSRRGSRRRSFHLWRKEVRRAAYVELEGVAMADGLALAAELVEEEEPAEAVVADEGGEAEEGERGDRGERELHYGVVARVAAPPLAIGVDDDDEVGGERHGGGEDEEHPPGERRPPGA